jgi:hypothetical protein
MKILREKSGCQAGLRALIKALTTAPFDSARSYSDILGKRLAAVIPAKS